MRHNYGCPGGCAAGWLHPIVLRVVLVRPSHTVPNMSVVAVSPTDTVRLSRERHTRKHDGRHIAWFVSDKYGQVLVISQKLGPVRDWINARASAPHERVNISSLYETATISKDSQRTGAHPTRGPDGSCAEGSARCRAAPLASCRRTRGQGSARPAEESGASTASTALSRQARSKPPRSSRGSTRPKPKRLTHQR